MQNLLIIESDLVISHFWANSICKKVPNIRLYNIVSTGTEAINIIKEEIVDIILLDLKLVDIAGTEIINFIIKNNITKYKSSIIVVTDEKKLSTRIIRNKYVFKCCSKINNIDAIINQVQKLANEKQESYSIISVKNKIKRELENLNFNFSYLGTKYLYECIYQCYCKNVLYDINLNKDIYPIISNKYNKSINSIKINIFQASSIMYDSTDETHLSKYFGYKIIEKPKTKDIIFTILQKIKNIMI